MFSPKAAKCEDRLPKEARKTNPVRHWTGRCWAPMIPSVMAKHVKHGAEISSLTTSANKVSMTLPSYKIFDYLWLLESIYLSAFLKEGGVK